MKINRDEVQKNDYPVLPAGTYRFEVDNVVRAVASSGNDMYQVRLKCFKEDGGTANVFDNLVETEKALWKFVQYFDCFGFDTDDTEAVLDTIGEIGNVVIDVEKRTGYSDRNVVKRYLAKPKAPEPAKAAPKGKKKPAPAPVVQPENSDDLPF